MHIPSLIEKKRDGLALTGEEISYLVAGLTDGSIPDYQWSALAMAIYLKGMTEAETAVLTRAMRDSGTILQYPAGHPRIVDKHSTGGIGDKVSLVLAPLLACCGVWCPMVSGRGLGITGGTLDKLESIPGFRVGLSEAEMLAQLQSIGVFMAGQTSSFCPADRKLYALRDVTGTVASIPLIVASILSKKLAENLDALVLDVKYGSGAFMKTEPAAQKLAQAMESVGQREGVTIFTQINPMDQPLGRTAGNALEVHEALACLQGHGPPDLEEITLSLAAALVPQGRHQLAKHLRDGTAYAKFQTMVAAQGGDLTAFAALPAAPYLADFLAPSTGALAQCQALTLGNIVLNLGGGRSQSTDAVDHAVGISELKKCGDFVQQGQPLMRIHARTQASLEAALAAAPQAFVISPPQ